MNVDKLRTSLNLSPSTHKLSLESLKSPANLVNAARTINAQGYSFGEIATCLLYDSTFERTKVAAIKQTMRHYPPRRFAQAEAYFTAMNNILSYANRASFDKEAEKFVDEAATLFAEYTYNETGGKPDLYHVFPDNNLKGPALDLATGANMDALLPTLNPAKEIIGVDNNRFIISYLKHLTKLHGINNFTILNKDILELSEKDFPKKLSLIRAKGTHVHVKGFNTDKLEELFPCLEDGGQFVIQNDPTSTHRHDVFAFYTDLGNKLISNGWKFDFEFGHDIYGDVENSKYDTLTFTKSPTSGNSKQWHDYAASSLSNLFSQTGALFPFVGLRTSYYIPPKEDSFYKESKPEIHTLSGTVAPYAIGVNRDGIRYWIDLEKGSLFTMKHREAS